MLSTARRNNRNGFNLVKKFIVRESTVGQNCNKDINQIKLSIIMFEEIVKRKKGHNKSRIT